MCTFWKIRNSYFLHQNYYWRKWIQDILQNDIIILFWIEIHFHAKQIIFISIKICLPKLFFIYTCFRSELNNVCHMIIDNIIMQTSNSVLSYFLLEGLNIWLKRFWMQWIACVTLNLVRRIINTSVVLFFGWKSDYFLVGIGFPDIFLLRILHRNRGIMWKLSKS